VDILTVLHEGPASQKQLAEELHEPLSNITHHVNELKEAGAIEVAFTRSVGNVEQHFYRATTTSEYGPEDLGRMTPEEHQSFSRIIVQSITAELLASLSAGMLSSDPFVGIAWDRLWLDEQGYRDLSENTQRFLDRSYEIAAEASGRVAKSGEEAKPYIAATLAFARSRKGPNTAATVGHLG
jgi:biotin operon repressor